RQIDIAQDECGRVVAGTEDQGLRAVDAHPAVIAGEIVEMLRRHDDGAVEPGLGQCAARSREALAVLGFGEGGVGRRRHRRQPFSAGTVPARYSEPQISTRAGSCAFATISARASRTLALAWAGRSARRAAAAASSALSVLCSPGTATVWTSRARPAKGCRM